MLVDDNPDVLECTAEMLSICGAEVRAFDSGADAIAELDRWVPDFILTDLDMPGMSGLQFMERVHAMESFAGLPFIAITGNGGARLESHLIAAGFAAFFMKPNYLERLLDFVQMPSKVLLAP